MDAEVLYCPSKWNKYHSEIYGGKDFILLSKPQRRYLAAHARMEYE
jgi:hypothetical protein